MTANDKLVKNIKLFILISGIISAIYSLNDTHYYYLLPSIPFLFGFLYYFLIPKNVYMGAGLSTMTLVLYIRYIIYPPILTLDNFSSISYPDLANHAIIIMLLEMGAIFIITHFFCWKKSCVGLKPYKPSLILPLALFCLSIILVYADPSALKNQHFIWEAQSINEEVVLGNNYIASSVIQWAQFFIVMYLFSFSFRRYNIGHKYFFYVSIIVLLFPCLYFYGNSRLSILIPILGFMFFVTKAYPDKAKHIVSFVGIYGLIAILLLTLQKTFKADSISDVNSVETSHLLNVYFGGLDNVIIGLKTIGSSGTLPYLFIIDSLRNAMGIAKYFDIPGSSVLFNYTFYGNAIAADQIPPTVYQGMLYFGNILFLIPTIIMTYFVCKFDALTAKTQSAPYAYLYITFIVIVAWAIPAAWTHLTARFFNYLIPLFILLYLNKSLAKSF